MSASPIPTPAASLCGCSPSEGPDCCCVELETLRAAFVLEQQRSANLTQALLSSRDIGVAIGVLMSTRKVPHDEAFALLRRASKSSNRKLRYVAGDVILTGTLPERTGHNGSQVGAPDIEC